MMTNSQHVYEVRPRKDKRGVDLISDALPFGALWYGELDAITNAIGYAKFYSRSHDAVIRVYDAAGNVIETHEYVGEVKRAVKFSTNRHLSAAAPPFGSLCYAIPAFKHCNCQRDDLFLSRAAGSIQILPTCKSGQFEKDLGLEASSARHAARLIIFEIMRSFFLGSKEQATNLAALHWWANARNLPHARRQC